MSAAALKKLGLGNGWVAERWHLKLADALSPTMGEQAAAALVFGVFGTAVLRNGFAVLGENPFGKILHLKNKEKRALAEEHLPLLSQLVGAPVSLVQAPTSSTGGRDVEFERECRARVDRLKVKTTNRGVLI